MGQALSLDELHAEKRAALKFRDLEDRHDIGMVEVGGQLGLASKPLAFLGGGHLARQDHLERDQPFQVLVSGLVDDAHAAAGDLLEHLVIADAAERRGSCPAGVFGAVPAALAAVSRGHRLLPA